jgi:hypothetical protein
MNEQEIYTHQAECPSCFANWHYVSHKIIEEGSKLCDYCSSRPIMSSKELLLRRIDVLDSAFAHRFCETLKHLIKHIDLKD